MNIEEGTESARPDGKGIALSTEIDSVAQETGKPGVYARAIEDATGEQVTRSILLFLRPEAAFQHSIPAGGPSQ